jgi:hypothetical protein
VIGSTFIIASNSHSTGLLIARCINKGDASIISTVKYIPFLKIGHTGPSSQSFGIFFASHTLVVIA